MEENKINQILKLIDSSFTTTALLDMKLALELISRNEIYIKDYPSMEDYLKDMKWIILDKEADAEKANIKLFQS